MATTLTTTGQGVLVQGGNIIPSPTPLTRPNYFDGKFLRAADFQSEDTYVRELVYMTNRAGGWGVVYGFDTTLGSGDKLELGPGLAMDPHGRTLFLPAAAELNIQDLIDAAQSRRMVVRERPGGAGFGPCEMVDTPSGTVTTGPALWLITLARAEALCGEENVYGRLCEDACDQGVDRPTRIEGVLVRARPLPPLRTPFATSRAVSLGRLHLRSLLASAYFEDEDEHWASLISARGLAAGTWCLGAQADDGAEVPVAVLARAGGATLFLDAWTARRERLEPPAALYWAGRMSMRSRQAYLAQILQFQCQLRGVLGSGGGITLIPDPCKDHVDVLRQASVMLKELEGQLSPAAAAGAASTADQPKMRRLDVAAAEAPALQLPGGIQRVLDLGDRMRGLLQRAAQQQAQRILINGGIVFLPPAGYLPVDPSAGTVNDQVRRLLGEGLDLRFCACRADYIPHAVEEAQHMERISLLQGLDDPHNLPRVDILVPDGKVLQATTRRTDGFAATLRVTPPQSQATTDTAGTAAPAGDVVRKVQLLDVAGRAIDASLYRAPTIDDGTRPTFTGVARVEAPSGGGAAYFAGTSPAIDRTLLGELTRAFRSAQAQTATAESGTPTTEAAGTANLKEALVTDVLQPRLEMLRTNLSTQTGPVPGALWLTLSSQRDPSSLPRGGVAPFSAELDFGVLAEGHALGIQLSIDGSLVVDAVSATGGGKRVTGRVQRAAITWSEVLDGQDRGAGATRLSASAVVTWTTDATKGDGVHIALTLPDGTLIALDAAWRGDPVQVRGTVGFAEPSGGDQTPTVGKAAAFGNTLSTAAAGQLENAFLQRSTTTVATAMLAQDPDVFDETDPRHIAAVTALARIERALGQPGFMAEAQAKLFPPQEAQQELTIQAVRDWVLFQRRREKTCAPQAPVAAARTFVVYELALDPQNLDAVVSALAGGGDVTRLGFREVGEVQFGAGSPSLTSNAGALRSAWSNAQPGDQILYAGIAVEAAARIDGDDLQMRRLSAVEDVVDAVTPVASGAPAELLPSVPPALRSGGADGIVVLLTRAGGVVCHDVWTQVVAAVAEVQPQHLGKVDFTKGTTTVPDQTLDDLVKVAQTGKVTRPTRATVTWPKGDTDEDPQVRVQQGRAILDALGFKDLNVAGGEVDMTLQPGDCHTRTTLVYAPGQQEAPVGRMYTAFLDPNNQRIIKGNSPELQFRYATDGSLLNGAPPSSVAPVLAKLSPPFTGVQLASREPISDADKQTRLKSIYAWLAQQGFLSKDASGKPNATQGLTDTTPAEEHLWTDDGIQAVDLVFLTKLG